MTEAAEYCRAIESYLCRKNEGHLIRIVGPVFEQVSGWAAQGVPLTVAFRGIEQYCERYYAKGPRRRPVRVEFCEADVLSLFDDWRRAVGVSTGGDTAAAREARDSLPAHLDRAIARLTALRARVSAAFSGRIEAAVRELDAARSGAAQARGAARDTLLARLRVLDRELLDAARHELDATRNAELSEAATAAAFDRLLRDAVGLPILIHES